MKVSLGVFQTGTSFSNAHCESLYSEQVYYRSDLSIDSSQAAQGDVISDYFLKCLKNNKLYTYVRTVTLQL